MKLSAASFKSVLCFAAAIFSAILYIGAASPAFSQAAESETLPIEIKMLYYKLLNRTPDYYEIIYSNPEFQNNRHKFGQEVLVNQQHMLLQKLYNEAGKSKQLYVQKPMMASSMSFKGRSILFEPIAIDDPILYKVSDTDVYGIFLRNGNLLASLAPPYEFDDFVSLEGAHMMQKGRFNVQLVLEPVAADPTPFILDNGTSVNVILADIVELKLLEDRDQKLLLYKRFNDNNGLPVPVPVAPANRDYMPLPPATEP